MGPGAAWRVLRTREFGFYFLGNALSASGGWFQNLAGALLIYRLTHSAFLLGVLNFSNFIPILVLAPWAGSIADRVDRRRLLLLTQTIAVGLAGGLALLRWGGAATPAVVIGFALALGVVSAFSAPAQQALIVSLVPREEVSTAVALNSMTFNLARVLGPALAAVTVTYLGIAAAFALNSLSYLVFVCVLLLVRPRPQRRATAEESRLRESFHLLRREPRLVAFLLIVTAVGFASDPVNTLAPAFAHAFGHRDTVSGAIIGVFGAGPLGLVLLFVAGFGYLASNTAATTQLQLGVDETQRGRIMALWSMGFLGLRPVASLLDGAIASVAGVRAAGVVLAVPALAGAAIIWLVIRRRDRASAASGT